MFATWLRFLFHFNFTGFAKYILYIFLPASCDGRVITSLGERGEGKSKHENALATKFHQVSLLVRILCLYENYFLQYLNSESDWKLL